jgi:hypothetical protein
MKNWRLVGGILFLFGVGVVLIGNSVLVSASTEHFSTKPPGHKVTLCHATDADKNPYVLITVDIASAGEAKSAKGHAAHTGPIWQAGDQAKHIKWGDIIPPYTYFGFSFPGLNWTAAGMAILENGCKAESEGTPPSPSQSPSSSPSESPSSSPSESPSSSPSQSPSSSPSQSPSSSPSQSPSPSASGGAPSPTPSASPTPISSTPSTPSGGVGGASETTTGTPLAETGQSAAGWNLGVILIALGLIFMVGGVVAWNRRPVM